MTVGLRIADQHGELGSAVPDRLGRVVFYGTLVGGQSFALPDIDYTLSPVDGDGAIFVKIFRNSFEVLVDPGSQGFTWNNTTKVLTNTGTVARDVLAVTFRRQDAPSSGSVGIVARNANNEVILDNLYQNIEIVEEGTKNVQQATVETITASIASYSNPLLFLRWDYASVAIIRGNNAQVMTTGTPGLYTNIDWKIGIVNPTTNRGTGSGPVFALYRPTDGVCLFSSYRKYARIRSIFAFDITSIAVNGPSFADYFYHATIPADAFFCLQPTYRTGSSAYAISRIDTGAAVGFLAGPVSAGQATSLGIPTLGSYPGAFHNTTLVIDP